MPKVRELGYSENTPAKQKKFREIIRRHLFLAKRVIGKKHEWLINEYHFYDMTAGPGIYEVDGQEIKGSPIIFLEEAIRIDLPFRAVFFEQDEEFAERLSSLINDDRCVIVNADHRIAFFDYVTQQNGKSEIGMVYFDPSGSLPPFGLIEAIAHLPQLYAVDILIHMAAANLKRAFHNPRSRVCERLTNFLNAIKKKKWFVSEPAGKHQWVFLMGTNWKRYPDISDIGMFDVLSKKGCSIINEISYANDDEIDMDIIAFFYTQIVKRGGVPSW